MVFELLVFVITVLVMCVYLNSYKKPKNFPPGPRGWPIVGSIFQMEEESHRYFRNLSDKYNSSVISLKLGTTDVVVLNDWKSMKEALLTQSELFAGRPHMFLLEQAVKKTNIAVTEGPMYRELKKFVLQYLHDIGVGKQSVEEIIMVEVNKTIAYLEQFKNNRVKVDQLFFIPILNIISRITTGVTYDVDDETIGNLNKAMDFYVKCLRNNSVLNFFPFLRHLPGVTNFNKFIASNEQVLDILRLKIRQHEETFVEGGSRDIIDCYLKEIYKGRDKKPSEYPFQKDNLVGTMYDLFNAGVETTAHAMEFAIMYMVIWPEIQYRIQAELDAVIGKGRLPNWKDRTLLPYVEATVNEILRYTSVVPLTIPHTPIANTVLLGYTIPKGTFVIPNIWAVHNDKALWGDPEVFRPERFLNSDGHVQKPEYLIPFSLGARFCFGEPLARMELFLFLTCLMQRFSFRRITGERPLNLEPIVGLTLQPQPFIVIIEQRS